MAVTRDMLLNELPPYRDEWVTISDRQGVKDIVRQMVKGYPIGMGQYDIIYPHFVGKTVLDTCNKLFDFCKTEIDYKEESVDWQSNELPVAILTDGVCDCKGYANFIGGCLGAMNRNMGADIDWQFYFAGYDPVLLRKPDLGDLYHVFVQVTTPDGPIWVDPTPGADGREPLYMHLETVDDAGGSVNGMRVFQDGTIGENTSAATTATAVGAFAVAALSGNYVAAVMAILPLITTWLKAYKYTGGDYALGEIFMNRVMDKPTTSRWNTPNEVVPIAWMYFSTLFGLPVAVNTDFDSIESGSLETYLQGRPEQRGYVTQAQVTRAKLLFDTLGHSSSQTVPQWPAEAFGLMPYAGPIPDPRIPGQLFSGTLPNGQQVVNGLPVSAATHGTNVQVPGMVTTTTGAGNTGIYILIAGAVLLLLYYMDD